MRVASRIRKRKRNVVLRKHPIKKRRIKARKKLPLRNSSHKNTTRLLKNRRMRARRKWKKTRKNLKLGINLVGFNRRETGIGESCRSAAKAIETAGLPFGIINYIEPVGFNETDFSWVRKEISKPVHKVNLLHFNSDTLQAFYHQVGRRFFQQHYNIGYWHWELPEFAEEWCGSFRYVQEVWVPSNFILDSVSRKSPVPVVRIPHCIEVNVPPGMNRSNFGLPENRFLFLSMFDARSILERKNPQGPIEAFKMAFDKNDASVGLVIKVNHPFPLAVDTIKQAVGDHQNIFVIANTIGRLEVNALINSIDCLVSLHRSEGFGLILAEAMYLGKPVIGTNWSGNIDFMNKMNSCPVNYHFVQVGLDFGPIRPHQIWAEPDTSHAASYMRRLVAEPAWRSEIALKGQETVRRQYSPAAVGVMIKQRLEKQGLL